MWQISYYECDIRVTRYVLWFLLSFPPCESRGSFIFRNNSWILLLNQCQWCANLDTSNPNPDESESTYKIFYMNTKKVFWLIAVCGQIPYGARSHSLLESESIFSFLRSESRFEFTHHWSVSVFLTIQIRSKVTFSFKHQADTINSIF